MCCVSPTVVPEGLLSFCIHVVGMNMVSSIAVVGKIDFKCVRLHVQANLRFKVHLSCDVAIGFVIFVLRLCFLRMLRSCCVACRLFVFSMFLGIFNVYIFNVSMSVFEFSRLKISAVRCFLESGFGCGVVWSLQGLCTVYLRSVQVCAWFLCVVDDFIGRSKLVVICLIRCCFRRMRIHVGFSTCS